MEKTGKEKLEGIANLKKRLQLIKEKPGKLRTSDIRLIYDFSGKLASKEYMGGLIQAIVLFGSSARGDRSEESDLDLLVLINDIENMITSEMASAYSLTVGSLLAKLNAQDKIHLTTIGMIRFWDGVRHGDPVIMTILRSGKSIVDTGFFNPLKALLEKGLIRPSREAVKSHLRLAKGLLKNTKAYLIRSVADLYWAVMDASHALIMHSGMEPTYPKDTPRVFVKAAKKHNLPDSQVEVLKSFVELMKSVTKGKIKEFTGKELDGLRKKAKAFVERINKIIK